MKLNTIRIITIIIAIFCISVHSEAKNNKANNERLDAQQKSLVAISSYTAQGKISELTVALNQGLDSGISINEINEALVQLYAYCGFPRSLNGINTLRKVLDERNGNGITDKQGEEIKMHSNEGDRYERGRKVLEELTKMHQSKPAPGFGEFSPRIDAFLKEHLFADIFESDILTYYQRELVTNAALASMSGVEPQLGAHLFFGMNVGFTESQLKDMFDIIEKTVGETAANEGREILNNLLKRVNGNK